MIKRIIMVVLLVLCVAGCGKEKVTDKQVSVSITHQHGTFENSGTYTGEVDKNGKPDGKGSFKSQNGKGLKWTYEGSFKNGTFDGKGSVTFDNGFKREGDYRDGAENGLIKETQNGKLCFEGEYKGGLREGKGKTFDVETGKVKYEGDYKKGFADGHGKVYNPDKSVKYDGNFVKGFAAKSVIGLNEKATSLEWEYSVSGVKTFKTIGNKAAGGIFVLVLVDAKNDSTLARSLGTNFFLLFDEQGRMFNPADVNSEYSWVTKTFGKAPYNEINPGLTNKGVHFFFDVPEDCKELMLIPSNDITGKASIVKIKG